MRISLLASVGLAATTVLWVSSSPATATTPTQRPGTYVPVTPANVLDTGVGIGAPAGPVAPYSTFAVQITGRGGIPATGVAAVAMTVAVIARGTGWVTVYPVGTARPAAASLDFNGRATTNLAFAKLGSGGAVDIYSGSSATTRIVINVSGYFLSGSATDAGAYVPLQPANILDTGTGVGVPGHVVRAVAAHSTVSLTVAGSGGVPASGAGAVVLNVAVISTTRSGWITTYPGGTARPGAASMDFAAEDQAATLTVVRVGTGGTVSFYNGSAASIRLVANVFGYFVAGTQVVVGSFVPVDPAPANIMPTAGSLQPAGNSSASLVLLDDRGFPASGRRAVLITVAAVSPTASGFATVSSGDAPRPLTANLDFSIGLTAMNAAVVDVGHTDNITLYNGSPASMNYQINLFGYFASAPATPMTWSAPTHIDHQQGGVDSVSCPTATFCLAMDEYGNQTTFDGHSWSTPRTVDYYRSLRAVSCVSPTFCVMINSYGARVYNGSTWGITAPISGSNGIDCVSTTFCVAYGGPTVQVFDGTSWAAPVTLPVQMGALSCASATFCIAAGSDSKGEGVAVRWDGSQWGSASVVYSTAISSISCPAATLCGATTAADTLLRFNGSTWTQVTPDPAQGDQLTDVECPTVAYCVAVGQTGSLNTPGYLRVYANGSWTSRIPTGLGVRPVIGCSAAGTCAIIDRSGSAITGTGATFGPPVPVDPWAGAMSAVSCASVTFCQAVDSVGRALLFNGTTWTPSAAEDLNHPMSAVSCPTTTFCAAGDAYGGVTTWSGSAWTPRLQLSPAYGVTGVSCTSATFCIAVDAQGDAYNYNGTAWSAPTVVDSAAGGLTGVSCVSGPFCMTVDGSEQFFTYSGSAWSAAASTGASAGTGNEQVSCASAAMCVVTMSNSMRHWNGVVWTTLSTPLVYGSIVSVSCPTTTFCAAADAGGYAITFDGSLWSEPTFFPEYDQQSGADPRSVSCVSPTFCMLVERDDARVGN